MGGEEKSLGRRMERKRAYVEIERGKRRGEEKLEVQRSVGFFSIALDDDSEVEVEGSRQPSLTSSGCGIGL